MLRPGWAPGSHAYPCDRVRLNCHRSSSTVVGALLHDSTSIVDAVRMPTIPTGTDVGIDDIPVQRVSAPRTNQPPIVVRYGGAVADVVQGPQTNTWGPRELLLSDWYDMHRVCGEAHDAVGIERSGIRPSDVKTTTPDHANRRRSGCFVLREHQHNVLRNVPERLQARNGFVSDGDYVFAVYENIEDMLIILDDARIAARDLERLCDPSFYPRGDDKYEASVEWHDVPGLSADEMIARLDAAPTYLRALGEDPDEYRDALDRVRDRVADAVEDKTTADTADTTDPAADAAEAAQSQ